MRRAAAFAGYAALGPFTGPLVAGAVRSFRRGDRVLAGLYVAAVGLVWVDLSLIAAVMAKQI